MARFGSLATHEEVADIVRDALSDGKNALSAVLSGYFFEAGKREGVVCAPFALLVGGLGEGVFAYDGRCRQPGKDAKRPRGFVEGEPIPLAARVAAPTSVSAAFLACAYNPGTSFLASVRPGIAAAKEVGSKGRAALLDIAASKGAGWLADSPLRKSFIAQFGSVEGGLMTPGDLVAPEGLQEKAARIEDEFRTPWKNATDEAPPGDYRAIVACDARGLFAALSYLEMDSGPTLEPYDVRVPILASPVLRGVTRIAPGTPFGFDDGLALRVIDGSVALAEARSKSGEVLRLDRDASSKEVMPRRSR